MNNHKCYLFILFVWTGSYLYSQPDACNAVTLPRQHLDRYLRLVNDSAKSHYYRQYYIFKDSIIEKVFYLNNNLYRLTTLSSVEPLVRNGTFKQFYDNGVMSEEGKYVGDLKEGQWVRYFEDGRPKYKMNYQANALTDTLKGFYENGNIKRIDVFKNNELIKGKCFDIEGNETDYVLYEQQARFMNGDLEKFRNMFQKN